MRTIFTMAIVSGLAIAAPAMAQQPGFFGAPSGHNNAYSAGSYGDQTGPSYYDNDRDYNRFGYDEYRPVPYGFGYGEYDRAPGRDSFGVPNPSGAIEGRAAAPDDDYVPPRNMHRRHRPVDDDASDMQR